MTTQSTALDTYLQRLPMILDKIEALRQLATTILATIRRCKLWVAPSPADAATAGR